jgi:hypothetical protein
MRLSRRGLRLGVFVGMLFGGEVSIMELVVHSRPRGLAPCVGRLNYFLEINYMTNNIVFQSSSQIYGELLSGLANDIAKSFISIDWSKLVPKIDLKSLVPPLEIEERLKTNLMLLAKRGWYLNGEMSLRLINIIGDEINKGKYVNADKYMRYYFDENYRTIKKNILTEFSNRSKILKKAFRAHERKEYSLSVPIFLIQADGICYESAKVSLYSKEKKKPKIAYVIESLNVGNYTSAMLLPISRNIPLYANENERTEPDYPKGSLNRNQVLHGETIDYGNKINSYKAISLLSYVSLIRESIDEMKAAHR